MKELLKKAVSVVLSAVLACSMLPVSAFAETIEASAEETKGATYTSGDYTYTILSDGTAEITDYNGSATSLTIPTTLGGYTVTSIGAEAFYCAHDLIWLTIPDNIVTIGDDAFHHCTSLASVSIGNGVTYIGDGAFYKSVITEITIPSSVKELGARVFEECLGLTTVTIPSTVETIGEYLFSGCENIHTAVINANISTIPVGIFVNCDSLSSVVLPNNITSIGGFAFSECNSLTNFTIPSTVTTIGEYAFQFTGLTSITIPDGVTTIGNMAFMCCNSLTDVVISDSVTTIGDSAFYNSYNIVNLTLGSGIETIGDDAFRSMDSLTTVYYNGDTYDWGRISIGENNDIFDTVDLYCLGTNFYADYVTHNSITLSWQGIDCAEKYRIQRYSGSAWKTIGYTSGYSYTDTDITAETTYKYRLLAYVNEAWRYVGDVVTVKATSAPKSLTAVVGNGKVELEWYHENSGETKYRIQRCTDSVWSTVGYTTATKYSDKIFTDTGLTNGKEYKYRVLAYVDGKWSSPSNVVSAYPSAYPQDLTAIGVDGKVLLYWTKYLGAEKYRIQKTTGSTWTTVKYTTTTLGWVDTSVVNGTAYKYRILAYADGVWSSASPVVTVTPKSVGKCVEISGADDFEDEKNGGCLATATFSLNSVSIEKGDIILIDYTLANPTEEIMNSYETYGKYMIGYYYYGGYGLEHGLDSLTGACFDIHEGYSPDFVLTNTFCIGEFDGSNYYAFDVDGMTLNYKFTIIPASSVKKSVNTTPQNVKATAGDKKVTLTWSAVSGATKYRVQRLNGSTWSTINYPVTTSYTDTSVTNGTVYKYRVLAYVDNTWSVASSAVSATPKSANVIPQNVKATAGDKNVKLTWTKVSGATKYRVQRLNGTTWSTVNYPATNSYTDTGLTNGTTYKYRVLAYVNGAWSTASSAVSAKPFNTTPKNVKATAGDKKVTLSWTAVSGATKYRVQRLNGTTWSTVNYPATNSYTDTGLTNGTAYKYRVLAYVNGVWSTASSAVSATPNAVDTIPKNVRAVGANKRVTITWTAVTGATKYRVQRTTGTSWTTVNYPTATTYVDTDVINGTTYKYRVLAYVNGVWSTPSSVVSAIPVSSGGSSVIG